MCPSGWRRKPPELMIQKNFLILLGLKYFPGLVHQKHLLVTEGHTFVIILLRLFSRSTESHIKFQQPTTYKQMVKHKFVIIK